MIKYPRHHPATDSLTLRKRVKAFFESAPKKKSTPEYDLFYEHRYQDSRVDYDANNITTFIELISSSIYDGDIYLFGGIIRDLAMFGQRGFNSDIDIVVDGSIENLIPLLTSRGAIKNKFGGFRLDVGNWPVDIWQADNTWAIQNKITRYEGISSLLSTTVLNWDSILMNWRSKVFLHSENYFYEIQERILDILLLENPNRLGMITRVLRHLHLKDASKISNKAVKYLTGETNFFSYPEIMNYEIKSYEKPIIKRELYDFFKGDNNLILNSKNTDSITTSNIDLFKMQTP